MRRRTFIATLGGAAATALLAPHARLGTTEAADRRLSRLGTPSTQGTWLAALVQRLHELNWIDGRTITLDVRWAEGRPERYAEIATEFVRRKVDVIVTSGSAVPALMKATSVIPIVFGDRWRSGRPGPGRLAGAAGRQRHRPLRTAARTRRQAA